MKQILLVLTLALASLSAGAQQDTLKYRVSLKDKSATTYSLKRPKAFLSKAAIERRKRQGLAIDSTDLPVCRKYVEAIRQQGARILLTGKWENFVTVSTNDTTLASRLTALPFVRSVELVWRMPAKGYQKAIKRDSISLKDLPVTDSLYYGAGTAQIGISHGERLHEAGFRGKGMTIAVIDGGFHNTDSIAAMQNIRIMGTRDFVDPEADLYAETSHGTSVLSCIGMNQPHVMVGTAPEADFWLLRSEDDHSEQLVEQDYWAAAVEFADSVGTDVINTSLGYYEFDDKTKNYQLHQLDGHYALISRQAAHLADKGIVLVCSAGNSGMDSWKKITPPGDAENVLTVGAISKKGTLAPFSSVGNTSDGRIKPDVVAVGLMADVMRPNGQLGQANGTSFASPIMCGMVTCLWQACPKLTAKELIELVRQSGDRVAHPDNIYGYGVPDMWKAYQTYRQSH